MTEERKREIERKIDLEIETEEELEELYQHNLEISRNQRTGCTVTNRNGKTYAGNMIWIEGNGSRAGHWRTV